jgi:HemY protein
MIRALWFAVKVALLVVAAVWVADRPGTIDIHWMEYDVTVQVGFVLLCGLAFLVMTLSIHSLLLFVTGFGGHWRHRRAGKRAQRGLKALALGYSAAAAGDAKIASYQAHRARLLLPDDRGLAALLESQAARLRGDTEAARLAYEELLANGDTALLGLRGLIGAAAGAGDLQGALNYARQALQVNPKSPWAVRTVYALEARSAAWDDAWRTLRAAEKRDLFPPDKISSDRAAMHVAQADEAERANRTGDMVAHLRKALKIDAGFVPAAVRLARFDLSRKRRREAAALLEKAWKANPHPELAEIWAEAAPGNKPYDVSSRLRWFEKLVSLRPDSAESQLAAAYIAGEDRLWTEARQYLVAAERIQPSARLYRLWAACEDAQGHFNEERRFADLAASAPPDKVWVCRESGRIYEQWSAIAEPHGSFNTIVWDHPQLRTGTGLSVDVGDFIDGAAMLPAARA